MADDLNVTHQAVRALLLDEVPEQYREAQRRGPVGQVNWATTELEQAADPVAIARMRELCRFLRRDAVRRLPQLSGQMQ